MLQTFRQAALMLIVLTVICGGLYPALVTGIAKTLFPNQAEGSMIKDGNGKVIGSPFIGQHFTNPTYFWGRLSATSPVPYNSAASSGSNLSIGSGDLMKNVQARVDALRLADPNNHEPVPVDLVTASASGLDPHISIAAANYQIKRVATARGISEEYVKKMVALHTEGRTLGILGEPVVNVLLLNLALDRASREGGK
ncbi:MAG: potassium-transporting ATPase subunit KdpC [Alphaproteobacteria bacterium]|nr:potassium-transporting ATPase subunit KdpC [Alphaproteobacteria bacterium]